MDQDPDAQWLPGPPTSQPSASPSGDPRPGAGSRIGDGRWTQLPSTGVQRFWSDDFDVRELPLSVRTDLTVPAPLVDTGVHDRHGVRMYHVDGRLRDHPVAQAQYGLYLVGLYAVLNYRIPRTGLVVSDPVPAYTTDHSGRAHRGAQRLSGRGPDQRKRPCRPQPY